MQRYHRRWRYNFQTNRYRCELARNDNEKDKGIFMKQHEYFEADYRTGKKKLKRDFARDTVALFENENATLNDMREGRKALKAKYKADKRTLKKESKRLEKDFRKDFGMFRRPIMADIFDFFEEARAVPNGRTPFNDEIKIEKDIVYKTIDGKQLLMDIYYPSRPIEGKSPCVMDIPGGGWMIHNRLRRDGYARCFAAMGAVVAVIDHRLCPEVFFPKDLEDCVDAYNFLCDNADRFGIDKDNITVTGDSSGGHLAACLGIVATDEEYAKSLAYFHSLNETVGTYFRKRSVQLRGDVSHSAHQHAYRQIRVGTKEQKSVQEMGVLQANQSLRVSQRKSSALLQQRRYDRLFVLGRGKAYGRGFEQGRREKRVHRRQKSFSFRPLLRASFPVCAGA